MRGPGLCTLLTVLLVGLKLTGHIDWSWWWVTAPLWGSFVLFIVIVFAAAVLGFLLDEWVARQERRSRP